MRVGERIKSSIDPAQPVESSRRFLSRPRNSRSCTLGDGMYHEKSGCYQHSFVIMSLRSSPHVLVFEYRLKRRMSRIFLICIFYVVILLISPNHRRLRIAWHQRIPHQDYRCFLESSYKSVATRRLFHGLTIKSLAERMLCGCHRCCARV